MYHASNNQWQTAGGCALSLLALVLVLMLVPIVLLLCHC
jgi:hypothetical protein